MWTAAGVAVGMALSGPATAGPTGMFQFSSGLRPLSLPVSGLMGGGLRAGPVFGPVAPFLGGSLTAAKGSPTDDDASTALHLWTGQLGTRLRVVQLEAAETYLVGGVFLSNVGGKSVWDAQRGRGSQSVLKVGPGAFLGGGADAFLSSHVSLGVEAGFGATGGETVTRWFDRQRFDQDTFGAGSKLWFTHAALSVTVWTGGGR